MRILVFALLVTVLTMCKSTDKIPTSDIIKYEVLLKDGVAIKTLKKDINHEILDAKPSSKSQNQWSINFDNADKKAKNIKKDLLNLEYVISVFTSSEIKNINTKNSKKGKVTIDKKIQKQK